MMRAHALDLVSAVMDAPERPLDGAAILRLSTPPSLEALERGAAAARERYPKSAAVLEGLCWRPAPAPPIAQLRAESAEARDRAIAGFLADRIDPARRASLKQALLVSPEGVELITHCHHAATDLMGGIVWVRRQLELAAGKEPSGGAVEPALWSHPSPRRKSRAAHWGASTRLFRRGRRPSAERRLRTIPLDFDRLRAIATGDGGYTPNDALVAAILAAFARWNARHGAPTRRLALWCPINVRVDAFAGFGNGSSRVRVYADPLEGGARERARGVRAQVKAAKDDGEWFVPPAPRVLSLPAWLRAPVLRAYLRRPGVDMASGVFSHVERLGPGALPGVDRVQLVGPLDRSYPVGLVLVSGALGMIHDPALWSDEDGLAFAGLLEEAIEEAVRP